MVKDESNLTSTPEKPVPTLAPPQLAQLRTETADSFDMEEVTGLIFESFVMVSCEH